MTCRHAYYDSKGDMQCKKDYPIRLMKCLKGGIACYMPKSEKTIEKLKRK